jgi:hypothetical protein
VRGKSQRELAEPATIGTSLAIPSPLRRHTMGRVEPNENPGERRGSEQPRQAERGRAGATPRKDEPAVGHTPTKAEGDERDVDEALEHGNK